MTGFRCRDLQHTEPSTRRQCHWRHPSIRSTGLIPNRSIEPANALNRPEAIHSLKDLSLTTVPNLYLLAKFCLWCSDQIARKHR